MPGAATLTVSPSALAAPDSVTVSWSGVSAPTSHDWIGVYHPGDPNNTPLGYFYDNSCTTTPGTTALASGLCTFTVPGLPNIAGTYELRLFSNDSFTLLATSNLVTVNQGATLTVNPLSLQGGDPVTVSWSGVSAPSSHDWVGVYLPGDPNILGIGRFYDNSCTDTADPPALASGSCSFVVPNLPNIAGTYVLRLFSNDSLTLLATSDPVTVSAGSGSVARAGARRAAVTTSRRRKWFAEACLAQLTAVPTSRRPISCRQAGALIEKQASPAVTGDAHLWQRRFAAGFRPPVSTLGLGVASVGLPSSAARCGLRAACGDGGAGPSLGGGEVGPVARRRSGRRGDEALSGGVAGWVVGVVVLPESPDDLAPRAAEDAGGVWVAGAAGSGAVIDVGRPGVVAAA